jgi:predicted metal-binding protein
LRIQNDLKKFCEIALKLGAFAAKPIPTSDIAVNDWVRLKCQYGCGGYDARFSCPPCTPTPTRTRQIIKKYQWAVLIGFSLPLGPYKDPKNYEPYIVLLQTKLFAIERAAFLAGYYKAFCFFSGPCMLCYPRGCRKKPSNVSDLIRFRLLGYQLPCRNPRMSRPAMEGCGINVFETAHKAGLPIRVLTSGREIPHNYGLLLVT